MPHVRLRQDTVRTLPYLSRGTKYQCIYWDSTIRSFGVRIYPSGRRTYVYSYRVNRRKRLGRIGPVDLVPLEQGKKRARALLGRAVTQQDPQAEQDALKGAPTVAELVKAYIEGYAKPHKVRWKEDRFSLRTYLVAPHGTILAQHLTSKEISKISLRIGADRPYAANGFLDRVRRMYNWAKAPAKLVPKDFENPATGVPRFPKRKRKRFITTVEAPLFVRALEQEENDFARHAIWLLLLTGLRKNEVLKAQWDNVDWDAGTLFIGLTKNGEPLLAPLCDAALARLKMIPRVEGNPYIICGLKPGGHLKDVHPAMVRILKRSGLKNLRTHDLRRTVGSWMAQSGISLHLIGDVLNHLDVSTTAGYAYFQTHDRRNALSCHADKLLKIANPLLAKDPSQTPLTAREVLGPASPIEVASEIPVRGRHYFSREALYHIGLGGG